MKRRRTKDETIYGRHAVAALFVRDPLGIKALWVVDGTRSDSLAEVLAQAADLGTPIHRVARATLDRVCAAPGHQGLAVQYRASNVLTTDAQTGQLGTAAKGSAGLAAVLDAANSGDRAEPVLLLLLDGVEDPRNLGACIRSAAAAGAAAVVVPRSRGAPLTPAARKTASGAAELVPLVEVANLARAMSDLASLGVTLVGAVADAQRTLYESDLRGPVALVLGGEGKGLRRLSREGCDELVSIPMASAGGASMSGAGQNPPGMESLNVSVAAGICLFEARRQRLMNPI